VSEADSVLFGRAELERAFTALGERLVRRGVVADIFIVGGAAMALAYDAARVTRNTRDFRCLPVHAVLRSLCSLLVSESGFVVECVDGVHA
jgi:predicted nucleic acid-binding protein